MNDTNLKQKAEVYTNFILERLDARINQIEKTSENQLKTLELLQHDCTKMQENLLSNKKIVLKKEPKLKPSISESLHNYIQAKKLVNEVTSKKKLEFHGDKENVPLPRVSERKSIVHHKENFYPTKESILKKTLQTPEKDSQFQQYGIITPQEKENSEKLNSSSFRKRSHKKSSVLNHSATDSKLSHSGKKRSAITVLGSNSINLQKNTENIE